MFCFMGLRRIEVAFLLIIYFVLLVVTFYRIMNDRNSGSVIKIAKAALAIFVPFLGISLIWAEILIRTILSGKRS